MIGYSVITLILLQVLVFVTIYVALTIYGWIKACKKRYFLKSAARNSTQDAQSKERRRLKVFIKAKKDHRRMKQMEEEE